MKISSFERISGADIALRGKIFPSRAAFFLFICSLFMILSVFLIVLMLSVKTLPFLSHIGLFKFLLSSEWSPLQGEFGISTMIVGTIYVTLGALLIGGPIGIGVAIFLAEISPAYLTSLLNPIIDLLAGIPSVIYGFYGMVVIVPWIRDTFGGPGYSVLSGSIVLGIMVLPTIISVGREAMQSVPNEYREGSMALGATKWQTILRVVVPAARSGIIAALVLGLGRAFGETMAVIMVTGNMADFPQSITSPVRTLTGNVVLEMGYATGEHQAALFATGFILLTFILIMNLLTHKVIKKGEAI